MPPLHPRSTEPIPSPPTSPPSPPSHPVPSSASLSRLLLEVDRLHRTLDLVSAALMEAQDRQEERNRRVDAELAQLRQALRQSAAPSSPSPLAESVAVLSAQPNERPPAVPTVVSRRSNAALLTVASSVPSSILQLLRTNSYYHEVQATPVGVNNVLWAYGLTEPGGARACESRLSVREHLRRESCLLGVRWDEALLTEYDALVRQEDGKDVAVDGPRFLEWKGACGPLCNRYLPRERPARDAQPAVPQRPQPLSVLQ